MSIRLAQKKDIPALKKLLNQIFQVHAQARPDLFKQKEEGSKFSEIELKELLQNELKPIFVYVDEKDQVLAHLFLTIQETKESKILKAVKTLFIEDLCVSEESRGQKIGLKLYHFAEEYARDKGCYNLTLNVWNANKDALKFYEHLGLSAKKTEMEKIL
ncbi:GNAT family N-acetyltransferase [Streptococcus macacae]|uniref:Acetyltransferase, GNAT family n=1 Tax=Streptococcus macacae NCTC 11558 TaxID=764298 RepID=G5JUL7_9STRE|nr:GNAT family N-acetyltransferase [Streptococcus macacae]EHJ53020.1 acetyltransferase, GNAT family [Streptococcus macacae NCTC 11558]SUN78658.1 acetyltransferase [Streptococcus macacae NCTC 11558]